MESNLATVLAPQPTMSVARQQLIVPATTQFAEYEEVKQDIPSDIPCFIEGPSNAVTLDDLIHKCIVPSWANGELAISHQDFIQAVYMAASNVFGKQHIGMPEIRASHQQLGRIPSALHKKSSELLDSDRTLYYQRMCFCIKVSMNDVINGNEVALFVGGVRALNNENLGTRRGVEKFKIFIGFRVSVCSNLMISTNGFISKLEVTDKLSIIDRAYQFFRDFDYDMNKNMFESLGNTSITTEDFTHIIGRLRLYEALSPVQRNELGLPQIIIGDQALNAATRSFVKDENFGIGNSGSITLHQFHNLLTQANKASYIDRFLEKDVNATDLSFGLAGALNGEDNNYKWFLQ